MKKNQASPVDAFQSVSLANNNAEHFFRHSYRKALYWAYSLAAQPNGWASCQFHVEKNVVYLETFYPDGQPHRAIAMWRKPNRDNEGYLFSVHTMGRTIPFRTHNLQHALGNFKTAKPVLNLL